jgi:putative holliday junction resolvase
VRRLAVDAGLARIGIAISESTLALPLDFVKNSAEAASEVVHLADSRGVSVVYVGLPMSLSGSLTASSLMAIDFGRRLSKLTSIPIQFIDERLTTKSAQAQLHQAGRNTKNSRSLVDSQAAALILEFAMASERDGQFAGKTLEELDA